MSGLARKSSHVDMVSDADRDAETLIVELLRSERPDDGLLGEEGADTPGTSGRRWVLDPLDGTTNFLYGYPGWCVSVALEDADGGLAGVVFDPERDELFRARRDGGAELNGTPVAVREAQGLARALVITGFSYSPEERRQQGRVLTELIPAIRDVRRGGSAALDLCAVAAGRADAYYQHGLKPWDLAGGRLIVEEAGGLVASLPGGGPGSVAAACSEALLEELLAAVGGGA